MGIQCWLNCKTEGGFHISLESYKLLEEEQSLLGSFGDVVQANIPSDCIAYTVCVPIHLCESVHVSATS